MRILDTDTCIAILRGRQEVIERRREIPDTVATTWINASELYYGAAKSDHPVRNKNLVDRFLDTLPVVGLDSDSAQYFGILKADLETAGNRLADADLWIGAIARAHHATVVTGNVRHFERIDGVEVENWMGRQK
jgi:tRNA(fMet)-specific endonuclease VapC